MGRRRLLKTRHTRTRARAGYGDNQAVERAARRLRGDCASGADTRVHVRAHAHETGTAYGDNRAYERAARRLRGASETAPNFAFFISGGREKPGRPRQAYRSREIGALGGSTDVLL